MKLKPFLRLLAFAIAAISGVISSPLSSAESNSGVTFVWRSEKASSANAAIMAFLGEPVPPPPNLDPRYMPEGLTAGFKALCQKLGYRVEKLAVDDTEFPFLVYGTTDRNDYKEMSAALRSMPGYTYGGSSTGSSNQSSYFALNMTPHDAYPREHREAIRRRTMIRLQMLAAIWKDPSR